MAFWFGNSPDWSFNFFPLPWLFFFSASFNLSLISCCQKTKLYLLKFLSGSLLVFMLLLAVAVAVPVAGVMQGEVGSPSYSARETKRAYILSPSLLSYFLL
jgi:hypothetical protein